MKKFALKGAALAIASVFAGSAFAGSISSPASDTAAVKYAVEALLSTTDVTLPTIQYTMGVDRTTAQDFTVIVTPSAGATFTAGSCASAIPTKVSGTGAFTATLKRASTTECAYEVDITTASDNTLVLGFAGLVLDTHTLNTVGSTASVTIALKDLGETAFIDNVGSLTRRVGIGTQAVNVYAATSDTATVADVNATGGPLTGFVVSGDDLAGVAKITNITFDNNSVGARNAANSANFDFTATAGTVSLTLTGNVSGAAANAFCIDLDNDGTLCEASGGSGSERFVVGATSATLSGIPASAFPAAGATATRLVSFGADGTTNLGTSRTYALTGTVTPAVGSSQALTDTNGKNATAWVWSANASQLMTPYMSTNTQYVTRFSLLNTGTTAVAYSARCFTEGSGTATAGAAGTLAAGATTVLAASSVCTFSGAPRGAVLFTINAPVNTVKGVYNIVDAVTGANGFVPLTRPYNAASTTE